MLGRHEEGTITRYDNLEDRVREIGLAIYEAIDDEMPSLFDGRGWKAEVLTKAMQDEAFKIQLFRFIDLLPALRTDIQVAGLFDEYFSDFGDTPPIIRKSLERRKEPRLLYERWICGKDIS